jgi:hypothetical protein
MHVGAVLAMHSGATSHLAPGAMVNGMVLVLTMLNNSPCPWCLATVHHESCSRSYRPNPKGERAVEAAIIQALQGKWPGFNFRSNKVGMKGLV